jgi:hypothetical protein
VHALHRACEAIHVLYKNVDKLMANKKKIYVKSPTSREFFREKIYRDVIPLPHLQELDISWSK